MLPDPFSPQPLVSALVSSYAAGRFMRGLLEDLEAQTLADQLEIVIVDSNSPENEGEIVAEFQQRYDNIVYLRTEERENSHVSLNRCLQLARGKYVTLANTDDRHVPDAFERLAALLEARTDAALAYADIALTKNEEDIICNRRQEDAEIMAYFRWPEFNPLSFFQQCYAGPQPMWRHSLHDKHGGFDPEFFYAGDYEFWLRLVSRGEIFVHLPAVLGTMLHTISSNSNANVDALGEESERARQRYWPPQMGPVPKKDGPAYLKLAEPYAQNQPERYPTKEPISVLIRVGQHPELLLASLTNLLSQNYPNLELLLLNQSGTDLTETLKQVPKLPRFVEVQAQGLDPVLARNLCLRLASGRYLFYLASGDRWHANHLLSHLKALATHRFVYSDVFRLPHRKTMASIERMARDLNNSPDLSRGSLLGQFVASTAISHRRSLLATLPLDPELLTAESELERWRELEAWRRAGLFGGQTLRYPDWDLQLLAIERIKPHRLRSMTCEYLDEAEPVPDGKPLLQRLQDSLGELTRIEAPALPELAVIVMAPQELAGLSALLPVQARVVLLAQGLEQPLPILPEASDVRSLRLSPCPLLELLAKGLAVAGARTVAVIPPGQLLRDPDPAARLAGLPGLAKREGVRALIGESWEPIVPTQLAEQWQRISILSATAADWQSWLQQRN